MSLRAKAESIVEKIKKYQEDTDGWKPAKVSVSFELISNFVNGDGSEKKSIADLKGWVRK